MSTFTCLNGGRAVVRSTVVLLAVSALGFTAGALFHDPVSFREISATFARAAIAPENQPAEFNVPGPPLAIGTVPPVPVDWDRSDDDRIPKPRECDLTKAISIDCVFMD